MRDVFLVLQPAVEGVQPAVAVARGGGLVPGEQVDDERLDILAFGVGQATPAVGPSAGAKVRGELVDRLEIGSTTKASRAGETAGRPRTANSSVNWASSNSAPSASRIRIARHPFGNACRAACAVPAGTAWPDRGHIVIIDRLWRLVHSAAHL
jgi:hypothetical protein